MKGGRAGGLRDYGCMGAVAARSASARRAQHTRALPPREGTCFGLGVGARRRFFSCFCFGGISGRRWGRTGLQTCDTKQAQQNVGAAARCSNAKREALTRHAPAQRAAYCNTTAGKPSLVH